MVKTVLGVAHQGLRDWVIQRVSAVIIAVYVVSFMGFLMLNPELSFAEWRTVFACFSVKIATLIFLLALLWHAWIGMWTIFTDYVKPYLLRGVLHVLVLLMLASCFLWGLMILWSV